MLSTNINGIQWSNIYGSGEIDVHVPREQTGLQESVQGTLDVSQQGYVYSLSSKPVLWLKFLGLATYLAASGTVTKCKQIGLSVLKRPVPEKEALDLKHIFHLAAIAGKAVIGKGHSSIKERVEQFALAEIDHNNSDRVAEMNFPRSVRLTSGAYVAKCMQPLFHKDQALPPKKLEEAIDAMETERNALAQELTARATRSEYWNYISFINAIPDPYPNLTNDAIKARIATIDAELQPKRMQLRTALSCNKYAVMAILKQQGCLTQAVKNAAVETQAELECCDVMVYKQQRICGLLYKIDCCAQSCFALDCLCCVCCFWPAGNSVCLIS